MSSFDYLNTFCMFPFWDNFWIYCWLKNTFFVLFFFQTLWCDGSDAHSAMLLIGHRFNSIRRNGWMIITIFGLFFLIYIFGFSSAVGHTHNSHGMKNIFKNIFLWPIKSIFYFWKRRGGGKTLCQMISGTKCQIWALKK